MMRMMRLLRECWSIQVLMFLWIKTRREFHTVLVTWIMWALRNAYEDRLIEETFHAVTLDWVLMMGDVALDPVLHFALHFVLVFVVVLLGQEHWLTWLRLISCLLPTVDSTVSFTARLFSCRMPYLVIKWVRRGESVTPFWLRVDS